MHGSQLRVAYQGVPGAYSEAAVGRAYPNCENIPCDQFKVAFQAVELWIADRAVLPVENSLGGSIHRNYDLLLHHRLYIVGEVQLPVHHCLLALPGVRKEYLTGVISHPQALAQCEHTLTNLGLNVAREAFDDTTAAAEYVATNGLRDTATIASARAAELPTSSFSSVPKDVQHLPVPVEELVGEPSKHTYASILRTSKPQAAPHLASVNKTGPVLPEWHHASQATLQLSHIRRSI